jgi:aminomethyltransferase
MGKRTSLYDEHIKSSAKIVDFAGWDMPLHYGSQIEEHHIVRESAGMFDVSHMGVVDIRGENAQAYLRHVLANDVLKLKNSGKGIYSCDDLIAYWIAPDFFRFIINAARVDGDFEWLTRQSEGFNSSLLLRRDLSIIAVQGPEAIALVQKVIESAGNLNLVKRFHTIFLDDIQFARTGYTGEDGLEIILPHSSAVVLWQQFLRAGIKPCGLGARDTLRLEAGYNLYGTDMNESTSPLISNLTWTVSFEDSARDFIGKNALIAEKAAGLRQQLVGVVMRDAGPLRNHQPIFMDKVQVGEITSGSFSPTLGYAIALARLPISIEKSLSVEKRGKYIPIHLAPLPFILKKQELIK